MAASTVMTDQQLKQKTLIRRGNDRTAARPIGSLLSRDFPKIQSKVEFGRCPHCGCELEDVLLNPNWPAERKRQAVWDRCRRPRCRWLSISSQDRLRIAMKAGVGRRFIRNEQGLLPEPGQERRLPKLAEFPAAFNGGLNIAELLPPASSFICGPVGTGKSWLMNCLAVEAMAAGYRVEIINWSLFKRRVRSSYQKAATETEQDIFSHYSAVGALCVDDLGVGIDQLGKETKAAVEMLYDLIEQRYRDNRMLHITSNLNPQALSQHYDSRIARRLLEHCRVVVLDKKLSIV